MKSAFIARGSRDQGLGHVMRSIKVASAMKRHSSVSLTVIGDDAPENLLQMSGLKYSLVRSEVDAMRVLEKDSPDVSIFDAVSLSRLFVQTLSLRRKSVSLSPIFDQIEMMDLVFHRTVCLNPAWTNQVRSSALRAGLQYAVIGDHVEQISTQAYQNNLKRDKLSISISMGGSDAPNRTLQLIEELAKLSEPALFWVLLGEGYSHCFNALIAAVKGSPHEFIFAKTNQSMWRVAQAASLAIFAGGVTTFEGAYAKLPTLNILRSSEETFLLDELSDAGVAEYYVGTVPQNSQNILQAISRLQSNRKLLLEMHLSAENLLDNLGADRICRDICLLTSSEKS